MSSEDEAFHQIHRLLNKGDLLALRAWLDDGGDPNSTNQFGWTLLMPCTVEPISLRLCLARALIQRD